MQDDALVAEFTHQARSFNATAAVRSRETLGALLELVPADPAARWLDAACGPGIVSRALAPRVGSVHGVDLTPAMVELAREEAAAAGIANATFAVGDATALEEPDAGFDGALARLTIHHVPVPIRLVEELARVVRPGGHVILADHVADADAEAAAWSQEIERLRDPSHWACLPVAGLRALGERAGLALEHEALLPYAHDFDDWVARGSGGPGARELIDRTVATAPAAAECFRVLAGDGGRRALAMRLWLSRWRRP